MSFQLAIRTRLYAGPDHLMVVQSTGYTEEYKRIFYGDLRYLTVVQTPRQMWTGIVSAIFIAIILIALLYWNLPWPAALLIGVPLLVWFAVNLFLGPTCRCYLNTHVQTVQLPAPRRMQKVPVLRAFLESKIPTFRPTGLEQPVA